VSTLSIAHTLIKQRDHLRYYLTLQFTRLQRRLRELGVHPVLGITLGVLVFGLLSKYLFYQVAAAKWMYTLAALYIILSLGDSQRVRPLKTLFNKAEYLKLRLFENVALAIPFVCYLVYEAEFWLALGLAVSAMLMIFLGGLGAIGNVIPTPFGKTPFENIIGFRKSFLLIGVIYFVLVKAIQVGNFNLSVACLGAVFFLMISFQMKPEPLHFVWIFSCDETTFLKRKLITAASCATLLAAPALLVLGIVFPGQIILSLLVFFVGQFFLLSMVLAKYSAYPNEMNVPQGILYALSLWFPPMLLVVCVLFYRKAKRNLKPILR